MPLHPRDPFPTVTGPQLQNAITKTQRIILHEMLHSSGVHFPENVAENEALRENIFMMVSSSRVIFWGKTKN